MVEPVRTVDAVETIPKASNSAAVVTSAPGSGPHTLQANRGMATAAEFGALNFESDKCSKKMSSADRYVASGLGGGIREFPDNETFPACGTYVPSQLDIIDGATLRLGTRLEIRKYNTTQTIGTKESYCPACKVIFATAWARLHLGSRQHRFILALETGTKLPAGGDL